MRRTTTGCSSPTSRMECTSSAIASSSKTWRGWRALGRTCGDAGARRSRSRPPARGARSPAVGGTGGRGSAVDRGRRVARRGRPPAARRRRAPSALGLRAGAVGISDPRPRPRPRRGGLGGGRHRGCSLGGDLAGGLEVAEGAGRRRIVGHHGLSVRRRLRHPDRAGDRGLEDLGRRSAPAPRSATPAASRVRASYIVTRIVETTSAGLRCLRTISTVSSSWPRPSSA